jgi:predicted flap endonuclease-1-like 5' DNA nuclease
MTYLITQTFILLLLAGLLGLLLGWYLTRISANAQKASMQARLDSASNDARSLRTELDAAVTAKSEAEASRKQLADELAGMQAGDSGADQAHAAELAKLRDELEACRSELAATAIDADEGDAAPVASSGPIAKVSAAAAMAAAVISGDDQPVAASATASGDDDAPPRADDAEADDLQQIKGIGPKIADILADMGIRRLDQIAGWTPENVAWVNERLKFKGRIEREQWIPQAKALLEQRDS